jgi:hypothetical protein
MLKFVISFDEVDQLQISWPTFSHILPNSFNYLDAPADQERETMLALLIFPSFRLALFADGQDDRSGGGIAAQTAVLLALDAACTVRPDALLSPLRWLDVCNAVDRGVVKARLPNRGINKFGCLQSGFTRAVLGTQSPRQRRSSPWFSSLSFSFPIRLVHLQTERI